VVETLRRVSGVLVRKREVDIASSLLLDASGRDCATRFRRDSAQARGRYRLVVAPGREWSRLCDAFPAR